MLEQASCYWLARHSLDGGLLAVDDVDAAFVDGVHTNAVEVVAVDDLGGIGGVEGYAYGFVNDGELDDIAGGGGGNGVALHGGAAGGDGHVLAIDFGHDDLARGQATHSEREGLTLVVDDAGIGEITA